MATELSPPIPILRMHDVPVTKRFYLEYLGCTLDWEEGEGDRPIDPASNRIRFFEASAPS